MPVTRILRTRTFFLMLALAPVCLFSQLTVQNTLTPEQLVQDILAGQGVTISNVTFNGQPGNVISPQIGFFNGTLSNIGLDSGLILATGDITLAPGPNNDNGATVGGGYPNSGDSDLSVLAQNSTNDKAVLEFDFVPVGDTVRFRYVFASEEYNEYVCSDFNDVFGFFISGPGFNGPFSLSSENIAIIPGTNTAVAINTINLGVPGSNGNAINCANIDPNWQSYNIYYEDNTGGLTVQYDGFTIVLEAVAAVQCGQTYHLKLAVADAGDAILDSGVFLEASSLQSLGIDISAVTTSGDSILIEGCNSASFIINRPTADSTLTLPISITGTATNGVDYNNLPSQISLPAGVFSDTLFLQGFFDGIDEGDETVILSIIYPTPCGLDSVTASLIIRDLDSLKGFVMKDTLLCTEQGQTVELFASATGGSGVYTFVWNTSDTANSIVVSPPNTTEYYVMVFDDCGNDGLSDTLVVQVQCPIIIPNVVTANNDNINDFFLIKNIEQYPGNEVIIYNRWGTIVFRATDYQNNYTPVDLVGGVYFYVVDNKVNPTYQGFLTIFKD